MMLDVQPLTVQHRTKKVTLHASGYKPKRHNSGVFFREILRLKDLNVYLVNFRVLVLITSAKKKAVRFIPI